MPDTRVTVVISQGQSRSPEKRQLEQDVAAATAAIPGVEALLVPHLYDLARDGETYSRLRAIEGELIVLAWLYDRATHWVLDRHGIRGQVGETLLKDASQDEEDEAESPTDPAEAESVDHVIDLQPRPERKIYCLDFRVSTSAQAFSSEIARIVQAHLATGLHKDQVSSDAMTKFMTPTNDTFVGADLSRSHDASSTSTSLMGVTSVTKIEEHPSRRWYPVIDFSRCTNCMECIDFCLFGVYGIDSVETILVEQPDNCRKGCPACSRVCPQNAIIFPQHKTPAIAGAPIDAGGLKIDLSKLFGAPEEDADAIEVAARERDEQLILAGRQAVGITESLAERLAESRDKPRDELDNLLDQLEALDL